MVNRSAGGTLFGGKCVGWRHVQRQPGKFRYKSFSTTCHSHLGFPLQQEAGIHDRFLRDPVYRESQLAIGWTEQKCKELDEFSKEDHTYRLIPEEQRRYQGQWYLTLNRSGKNGLMILRSDFRPAVSIKNRLHRESGEQVEEPISPEQYRRWHPSSSTSWWDKSEWNWK